jgi:hypothetical protein
MVGARTIWARSAHLIMLFCLLQMVKMVKSKDKSNNIVYVGCGRAETTANPRPCTSEFGLAVR